MALSAVVFYDRAGVEFSCFALHECGRTNCV